MKALILVSILSIGTCAVAVSDVIPDFELPKIPNETGIVRPPFQPLYRIGVAFGFATPAMGIGSSGALQQRSCHGE